MKSKFEIFLSIIEKMIIPIALVFIGYQQLRLNNIQEKRIIDQSKNDIEIKYLELFYNDITNKEKQAQAISLLSVMNEDLALKLIDNMVLSNEEIPDKIKSKIPIKLRTKAIIQSLNKYTIEIFIKENDIINTDKKNRLIVQLKNIGYNQKIKTKIINKVNSTILFKNLKNTNVNQIRFDSLNEKEIAVFLKDILGKSDETKLNLINVLNASPNYISIFLIN